MKKAIVLMLIFCGLAFSQTARQKLIVSVSGELPLDMADVLMDGVSYGIKRNHNNKYDVMANDRQFKAALKREWNSGNISDDKIMDLAKSAGADFLCFAKINSVRGLKGKQVVTQLISLNSSPMITVQDGMVTIKDDFEDLGHLTSVFLDVVDDMLSTNDSGENFSTGERWATFGLNFFFGLGSIIIMDNWFDGIFQAVCIGGGLWLWQADLIIENEKRDEFNLNKVLAISLFSTSFLVNIITSADSNKPKNVSYGKHGNFNMAVLPNKHGSFNTYFMYSKGF
jgi:hypothetical protein